MRKKLINAVKEVLLIPKKTTELINRVKVLQTELGKKTNDIKRDLVVRSNGLRGELINRTKEIRLELNTMQVINKRFRLHYDEASQYYKTICNFSSYQSRSDFSNIYLDLISGLDYESRETVTRIHRRIEMFLEAGGKIDIFTDTEKERLGYQMDWYQNNVFHLGEDLWAFGGYFLPQSVTQHLTHQFFDKYGTNQIENKEKIINKHIIDAGAYIGDSLLILSPLTHKQVHCFEPTTKTFEAINKTIKYNDISNAIPVKAALGDKTGKSRFFVMSADMGKLDSIIEASSQEYEQEEVDVMTLDSYVENLNLEVGLVKVDVSGAEQLFLDGAKKTIVSQKPTLLISIYHNPEDFYFIKPIVESWDLGYKFKIHKPIQRDIIGETTLICEA